MLPTVKNNQLFYSSKLIAQATDKQHKHVLRDIREMLSKLDGPDLGYHEKTNKKGNTSEFLLDDDLTKTLITGYSVKLRHAVILRIKELEQHLAERQAARLEAPQMTRALELSRQWHGKETAAHHYSNEYDMINRIVLGSTAKKYRERHGFDDKQPIRDTLTALETSAIADLQRINTALIDAGMEYQERKAKLEQVFMRKHNARLVAEVQRLQA